MKTTIAFLAGMMLSGVAFADNHGAAHSTTTKTPPPAAATTPAPAAPGTPVAGKMTLEQAKAACQKEKAANVDTCAADKMKKLM